MRSRAQVASCVRLSSPTLASALRTWLSTVRTERYSSAAIALFARPSATRRTTSTSRALRPAGAEARGRDVPNASAIASSTPRREPSAQIRSASAPRAASHVALTRYIWSRKKRGKPPPTLTRIAHAAATTLSARAGSRAAVTPAWPMSAYGSRVESR